MQASEYQQYLDYLRGYLDEQIMGKIEPVFQQLRQGLMQDSLTGLWNRSMFQSRLPDIVEQARQSGEMVGLLLVDLDRFRTVNEVFGHDVGDALLVQVAARLQAACAAYAAAETFLARVGGDEFAIIMPHINKAAEARYLAEAIQKELTPRYLIRTQNLFITSSIGIVVHVPHGGNPAAEMLRQVDGALHLAKTQGRNTYHVYNDQENQQLQESTRIEYELRHAIERNELYLVYQPLVSTHTGEIAGVEALVRWQHPTRGDLSPGYFVTVAEQSGLIVPIGKWIMQQACAQNVRWQERGHSIFVAVNVSAAQFMQANFEQTVRDVLDATGLHPTWLELELTESIMMRQVEHNIQKLKLLRELGVGVAIDDFGTGYSSLSYLQQLPVNTLKIDASFVWGIGDDAQRTSRSMAIIQAINSLAHQLGLSVIAEGVETDAQKQFLQSIACDNLQGYLFSRPVPAEKIEPLFGKPLIDTRPSYVT